MHLDYGWVSLKELYSFTQKYYGNEEALRIERTPLGRAYSQLCNKLTAEVANPPGFYLWGYYDKKRSWHTIYLGKAGFGKSTGLRKRILEELKDERCSIWRSVFTCEQLHAIRDRIHRGQYEAGWNRAMEKAGTTHIVWVAAPSIQSDKIVRVEADLIEALNPTANKQRPTPPNTVQEDATRIFQAFRQAVHEARDTAHVMRVKGK